jgi:U3 small nucleolar RNA-associated protein 13
VSGFVCNRFAGLVQIWEVTEGRKVFTQANSLVSKAAEEGGLAVVQLLFNAEKMLLAVVSADHNIIVHQLETFACEKQVWLLYEGVSRNSFTEMIVKYTTPNKRV